MKGEKVKTSSEQKCRTQDQAGKFSSAQILGFSHLKNHQFNSGLKH